MSKRLDLAKVKKAHFIGIGGIGISAVARMFLLEKKEVSGSDTAESEITRELQKLGVKMFVGQRKENLPKKADLVIYTIAIPKTNPEYAEAVHLGIPMKSYPEMLEQLSDGKFTIAVAGTHGKTTTTAMIASVLIDAKLDPTVIVGSLLNAEHTQNKHKAVQTNFVAGHSKYFVVEACEYRRSFLHIHPTILVITNIDTDHLDYYKDLGEIEKAFGELAVKVPKNGYIVTNITDRNIRPAIKNAKAKIVDYAEFRKKDIQLKVPGAHNRENAAAALAVAHILEIEKKKAVKSLEDFQGTWRRFEYKGKMKNGAMVYDDYGHHPTEIAATLAGAREAYPDKKITIVFQPHLFSRTREHFNDFAKVLSHADRSVLAPIYAAREPFDKSVSSEKLILKVKERNKHALYFETFEGIVAELEKSSSKKDLIIVMGAGDITKLSDSLVSN